MRAPSDSSPKRSPGPSPGPSPGDQGLGSLPQTVEEEWRSALSFPFEINVLIHAVSAPPLSISSFPQSPWRQHPSHRCHGDSGQVPDGAGRGGWFGHAQARASAGSVGGHGGGGAEPGAHAAMGERAGPALGVAGLVLDLRQPASFPAPFQEVCKHLTFALHADLASADKVVVVCHEAMDVFSHLKKKHGEVVHDVLH